ncbi:MAG: 50S ribosomal protein L24 [Candidatus Brennerbacteria bacterium]
MLKIKIKKGDTVVMRSGKDRGKSGKVLHVSPTRGRLSVEGANLVKKHVRPKRQGEKGDLVSVPRTVPFGAVALFCSKCNRGVKVGVKVNENTRTRVCRRCGSTI